MNFGRVRELLDLTDRMRGYFIEYFEIGSLIFIVWFFLIPLQFNFFLFKLLYLFGAWGINFFSVFTRYLFWSCLKYIFV